MLVYIFLSMRLIYSKYKPCQILSQWNSIHLKNHAFDNVRETPIEFRHLHVCEPNNHQDCVSIFISDTADKIVSIGDSVFYVSLTSRLAVYHKWLLHLRVGYEYLVGEFVERIHPLSEHQKIVSKFPTTGSFSGNWKSSLRHLHVRVRFDHD